MKKWCKRSSVLTWGNTDEIIHLDTFTSTLYYSQMFLYVLKELNNMHSVFIFNGSTYIQNDLSLKEMLTVSSLSCVLND